MGIERQKPDPKGAGSSVKRHHKDNTFKPKYQIVEPTLSQTIRLFDGIKDTTGLCGTRTIQHLISEEFCGRQDVQKRCDAARQDKAKKSNLYVCTYAHKLDRKAGAVIEPSGLLPLDLDSLTEPDSFIKKALDSGCAFVKPSISRGYHLAYMYDVSLDYNRALQAAILYTQHHTGEIVDANATNDVRAFYLSDKAATIAKEAVIFDLDLIEWVEANLKPTETPAIPRTTVKRGRPSNSITKMQGFLNEIEFCEGLTPEDGSWNSCLRKFCEKVAGAGLDQDQAVEFARDVFEPTKASEREFISMFTRAYKEVAAKELAKAQEIAQEMETEGYEFARIGGVYFRITDGKLQRWQQREVQRTLGKEWELKVLKLDGGFVHKPNNISYSQCVGDCWNLQKPTPQYEVKTDHCNTILKVISHIAELSSNVDILLDYLQIAYCNPAQKLPVLVLTSKLQGTGKSTFFQLVNLMFGGNTFTGSVDDVSGNFTAGWAHSQMICLEESSTDRRAQNDRIKYLTTTTQIKYEPKGVDPTMTPFFGKLMIANNNEDSPIYLQDTDQRYMVLRVGVVKDYDSQLLQKMASEMGYFLRWLTTQRKLTTANESRLWFNQSIIETEATAAAKEAARPIADIVIDALRVCIKTDYPDTDTAAVRPCSFRAFTLHLGYEYNQRNSAAALRRAGERKGVKHAEVFEFYAGGENWMRERLEGTNYVYYIAL